MKKIYLAILSILFLSTISIGQTIIDPIGDGGFETGNTFATNGWTTAQTGENLWYVGIFAKTNGTNGAYIDANTTTGTKNDYNNNSARVNYIYRDVIFPAGATNITLSFKWKANGENGNNNDKWDFLRVYLPSNAITPAPGVILVRNATNNAIFEKLNNVTTWQTATITLASATYAGTTKRLMFCWNNDANGGSNPSAAIDEISLTYTPACAAPSINTQPASQAICTGDNTTFTVGASGSSLTYQWQVSTGGAYTNISNVGVYSNATTATLNITSATALMIGYKYQVIVSSGACNTTSSAAILTVNSPPAQPSTITGTASACAGSIQIYTVTNVAGVTYAWNIPAGWTLNSGQGTNSVSYTVGTTSGSVQVTPSNGCGNGTANTLAVNVSTVAPVQPGAISGNVFPCAGTSLNYSVPNIAGVSYAWLAPAGWTISAGQGTNTITVTVGTNAGNIQVTPSNGCGNGTAQSVAVSANIVPSQPSVITGNNAPCAGTQEIYAVTNVAGVNYTWTVPAGWSVVSGQGTNSITYAIGTVSGTVQVTPSNTCGNGTARSFGVTVNNVPAQPSAISGPSLACAGFTQNYSVANVAGVTYTWNIPVGWTINSGQGTNVVTYLVGAASGTIQVTPSNTCGAGTGRSLAVTTTTTGTWLGSVSTDWNNAANWCGGIPTATTDVVIPAVGSVNFQPIITAAGGICRNITITGTLGFSGAFNLDVYGDFINNGGFTAAANSSVTFRGGTGNTLAGTNATTFYNLTVNKTATANTLTSITKAFKATNLTVTQGDLIMNSDDDYYVVAVDVNVPANGILTHGVYWDANYHSLNVGGSFLIDGIFNYTTRSTVKMYGTGTRYIRTGNNILSGFSLLLLQNGNFSANGATLINDNFYPMFGTSGSFTTNGQTITANGSVLMNGGSVNINGGTFNITGGMAVGLAGGLSATVNFSAGTLNVDALNVGTTATAVFGVFNHSGGTANIQNLIINNTSTASVYNCTNSPVINITGNWTNNETFNAGGSQVNFVGTALQTVGGTIQTTFNNFKINNPAGITLATSATVNNTLDLTNGLITTGGNVITLPAAGVITNASAASYINGKLSRGFNTGAGAKVFPVGKGGNYKPLTFTYISSASTSTITLEQFESPITGTITPGTVTPDVRYWDITRTGGGTISYTVTLDPTFTPTPAGALAQVIKKEGTSAALTATPAISPSYTNSPAYTTFNNGSGGTNSFALGSDCSSSANIGATLTPICQGGTTALLGGSISGTTTTGIWTDGGVGGTFNPNATTLNATWTPPATYSGTAILTLTPTGGVCTPNTAASKNQVVNAAPVVTSSPANQITCAGSGIVFSVTATGTSPTYQWQYSANNTTFANVVNGTPAYITYTNANTANLTVTPSAVAAAGTYYYRCIVSVANCSSVMSNAATLTVNINSTISLSSGAGTDAQSLCANTPITNITYAIGGGGNGAALSSGAFPPGVTGNYNAGVYTISGIPLVNVAGTFNYTITTTGPCSQASKSGSISVIAAPTGIFTSTENSGTLNDNIICAGAPVTFTAPSGYNSYTFYVNGTQVQGPNTTNTFISSTLTNNASVTVLVANGNNCGTTFGPIVITVNPAPTATLMADQTAICPGDMVTFTAGTTVTGNTYNFKLNGSSVQTGTSNIYTTTTFTAGNNPVTVDITNSNGCTATSAPVSVAVNPLPVGTLISNPSTSSNTASICAGDNITFTATGGYSSYEFFVNGVSQGVTLVNTFSSITLTNPSIVSVKVTNTSGCSKTFNAIAVTVNPKPTGTIAITENSGIHDNNEICLGSPVTYTFSNSTYSTYVWKINGVTKPGSTNVFTTTELMNTGDPVTVTVTSGSGCSSTFTASSVTIVSSPSGTLAVSPSNVICEGDNVVFTVSPLDPTYTYTFKVDGNTVQTGLGINTFSTNATIAGSFVVDVDIANTNSCISTTNVINVTVNALPSGTMVAVENAGTADDGIICTGTPVVFTVPTGFTNYNFIINNISVQSGSSNTYLTSSLNDGDVVKVAVTNSSNCIGFLNTITIQVKPLPVVAAIGGGSPSVCLNSNTPAFTDATIPGTWSVTNGTGAATITSGGVATGTAAGYVTINYTVTNGNGCTTTVTTPLTVNALPVVAPITGIVNICTTVTSQLSDITTGVTNVWSSDNTGIASIDAITGLVTGVAAGSTNINYTVTDANGCSTTVSTVVSVTFFPSVAVTTSNSPSGFNVCEGGTISLKNTSPGGTWSSSNPSAATVSATGIVNGISSTSGPVIISYTIITTCGPAFNPQLITVNAPPSATITYNSGNPLCTTSGPMVVNQTGTPGGTYSATGGLSIDPNSGTITPGATGGIYTITYSIDASASGCGIYQTTTSVTITTLPTITSLSYNASPYCTTSSTASPSLVASTTSGTYTYSVTSGGPTLSINSSTGVINPSASSGGTYDVTYTIAASGGCALVSKTTSVTITALPTITSFSYPGSPYCSTVTTANPSVTASASGTYSYAVTTGGPTLTINSLTGVINPSASSSGTYAVTYTIAASANCALVSQSTTVTINPAPSAIAGANFSTCSNNPPVNVTGGSSATNYSTVVWSSSGTGTFANQGNLTTTTYAPSIADISAGSVTITLTVNGNSGCASPATSTKLLTISAPPPAFTLTPASASICQGDIQSLTATNNTPTTGTVTISSGPISVAIPDAQRNCFFCGITPGSVTTNLSVTSIPAGAFVTGMSINFNLTHTYDGDLVLNVKAPNGNVLNLINNRGGSGRNFINTTISSTGATPVSGGIAPFTSTYSADNRNNVGTPNSGNLNFPGLYSTPNGLWTFGAEDDGQGDVGTITSWSITFDYTIPVSPLSVVWSPLSGLYSDPAATTTAYTGSPASTVYAQPATTTTYSATATNAANCSTVQNVTVTVKPLPVVTISADYCARAGYVRLTATSVPAATSFNWSTGVTTPGGSTSSIDVDIASDYDVTAFQSAGGCPGTATINVANELVTNGNFEAGNSGFVTPPLGGNQYQYRADIAGNNELVPEGLYGVGTNGQNYHPSFWGHDHTTGTGNFMIVNGFPNGNPQPIVWQETVTVLPNTTYYFSAWGMSLNNAGPYASLRFDVSGFGQVGTTATLGAGQNNNNNNGWTRFYGTLMTGATQTTAIISIVDLQNAPGGNDFGLDDISFGTLSTFINLYSAPGTDAQTPCINTPITPIVYTVGSSATSPIITPALPTGLTSSFNGVYFTISGIPSVAGNYAYTITTSGSCQPSTATGTINVQSQTITLTSGSNAPVCINTNLPALVYTVGGTATGATITPTLPAGLNGVYDVPTKTFKITGVPTVSGIFNYTITTSGSCTSTTISGSINVSEQTITLNTANNVQTKCINMPIDNIQYTIGGTGTGVTLPIAGLPAGVTGTYNSGFLIISGMPSVSGTFNYTVNTTGTCSPATATGTITVTPNATFTLNSGNNNQTTCINTAIASINYTINNATSYTVSGLPAGVTGSAVSSQIFSISGAPTAPDGTYNYTITTTGGCGAGTATGSITVQSQTITLTSGGASPTVCVNTQLIPDIVYTIGGTGSGATVTGLPSGMGYIYDPVLNTLTIRGTPTTSAGIPFTYVVNVTGGCSNPAATATGTITVNAAAIGGTLTSTVICGGGGATLTLFGQVGTIRRWESSTDNFNTVITPIVNTTISLTFTNVIVPTQYRVIVGNNCGDVASTTASISIHNYWTGAGGDNNWNTVSNWSDNAVPTAGCATTYIPNTGNPLTQPVINSNTTNIGSLIIYPGATLTMQTNGMIHIAGSITADPGSFDARNGSVEFNGNAAQIVSGNTFSGRTIQNLVVSNGNTANGLSLTSTAGDTLNVTGTLSFGASTTTADFKTNDNLTIKSSPTNTANVDKITGSNTISGKVNVERYIPVLRKAWHMLAPNTLGTTISAAWQEGAQATMANPIADPHHGYGTIINSNLTNWVNLGFDNPISASGLPSLKYYDYNGNSGAGNYVSVPSTIAPNSWNSQLGYFLFIRGDRTILTTTPGKSSTTLRSKGLLFQPSNAPASLNGLPVGKSIMIGNPYASTIDFYALGVTNIVSSYIIWDPNGNNSLEQNQFNTGIFRTIKKVGGVLVEVPGTGIGNSNFPGSIPNLQSGQAFFVTAFGGTGAVTFSENAKLSSAATSTIYPFFAKTKEVAPAQLWATLYSAKGGRELADGVLNLFSEDYSNQYDKDDAEKMPNNSENMGISSNGRILSIESSQLPKQTDTIHYNMDKWKVQNYQLAFATKNMESTGLQPYLNDRYKNTQTKISLDDTTWIDFDIANIPASYAEDRFYVTFKPAQALPVQLITLTATPKVAKVEVGWKTENEVNVKEYEIERSEDSHLFKKMTTIPSTQKGSDIYKWLDESAAMGWNYYRIRSIDNDGKSGLSGVAKAYIQTRPGRMLVAPNPVVNGKINLVFKDEPTGNYWVRLLNSLGQPMLSKKISHIGGTNNYVINNDFLLAHELYQLEITKPDGSIELIKVVY